MRYKSDEISALNKIYNATSSLIKNKDYDKLTISEIIRESKISRSTFYVYFKDKDQILIHICNDIFDHIFSNKLNKEKNHDFSLSDDSIHLLTHSFCHFLEDKELILPILNSSGSSTFLSVLRKRLKPLILSLVDKKIIGNNDLPLDMKVHQYINGYVALLQYYLRHAYDLKPELISEYYLKLYK
ncbi:MAG: TetR/AcrR family transcriptional regulator [Bacilli bacterium]|nr:TetR/AcrR family transcriptional regulator [Bacilli bacterium]